MNFFQYQFRQIKKFPDWLFFLPAKFLLFLRYLMRTEIVDEDNVLAQKNPPAISVTWHNRLLFLPLLFPRWHRKRTLAVISASRDGEYIAALCRQLGVGSLRGSSSRKGASVLMGAVKSILKERKYVSFTPDGPRGPKYHMNKGPIFLASETGTPLYLVAINYSSYWELKSWDRFQIPKPWAKVTAHIAKPIYIPGNLTEEELEKYRLEVEQKLRSMTLDKEDRKEEKLHQ